MSRGGFIAGGIVLLSFFILPHAAYASDDLVGYWKLDEGSGTTAIDSSGNGWDGTIVNTSYSAAAPDVDFSDPYSLYFDPENSGRVVTTSLSLNNYDQFTLAGWAYPTAATERMSWFGQNDVLEFGFGDSDSLFCYTASGQTDWDFDPDTFLNHWHNITCLGDGTDLIIYIDGIAVASASAPGPYGSSGDTFSIGAGGIDGGDTGPFSGYIDDVRVYNRGLTPAEMAGLGTGDAGPSAPLSVESFLPADDATGVALDAGLALTFGTSTVATSTGSIGLYQTSDDTLVDMFAADSPRITRNVTADSTIFSIDPSVTLDENTGYYVSIASTTFQDGLGTFYGGTASTTWSFTTGDFTPPGVSLTAPDDGETFLKGELVTLSADADDAGIDEVRFFVNGVAIYPDDSSPYSFDWNTSATSTGTKTVVAVAKDTSGNYATSSPVTFNVINFQGSGTTDDPYQIEECFQFPVMNDYLSAHYVLAGDLDCSGIEEDVMIGAPDTPFTGSFDGEGHVVTMNISDTSDDSIGLFRTTDGATIENIGLLGQIAGGIMTGSLIGHAADTTVINASSSAFVVGLGESFSPPLLGTGGLIGTMISGSIFGSHYAGTMLGYAAVGGIVGSASSEALISRSFNSGLVYGGLGGGGIVGYMLTGAQVRNSYSDGSVLMFDEFRGALPVDGAFGGIAGLMFGGTISRSYAAGSVGSTDLLYPSAGLVGLISGDGNRIAYSFAAAEAIGDDENAAGLIGGTIEGTTTLIGNAFDTAATGQSLCRLDTPSDFTGCAAIDTDDAAYWKDAAHGPIDHFNTTDVWDLGQVGNYPVLRAYLGVEPVESDEPDSPEDDSGDPAPEQASISSGGGITGLFGTIGVYKGIGSGYVAPRPQIVYPDGHVVYLDTGAGDPVEAPSGSPAAPSFNRTLQLGMEGADVRQLQQFLNVQGFAVASSGPGSPGNETAYFGTRTKAALIAFQEAHAGDILVPVGLQKGTGILGPSTRAFIASL